MRQRKVDGTSMDARNIMVSMLLRRLFRIIFFASAFAAPLTYGEQPPPAPAAGTAALGIEAPFPDIRQLVLDVEKNERNEEILRKDYTYHVHSEQQDFAGNEQ